MRRSGSRSSRCTRGTSRARRAGLVGGWCARLERRFHPAMEPPDVQGDDLVAVVDGLLAR